MAKSKQKQVEEIIQVARKARTDWALDCLAEQGQHLAYMGAVPQFFADNLTYLVKENHDGDLSVCKTQGLTVPENPLALSGPGTGK